MKRLRVLIFFLLCVVLPNVHAAEKLAGLKIRARDGTNPFDYDPQTGQMIWTGGVIVTFEDVVLTANKITVNEQSGEALAEGAVTIKSRDGIWTGEKIVYNFKSKRMGGDSFKMAREPFFITGEALAGSDTNKTHTASNVLITTDDYATPSYKIRARTLILVPGEYFEAEDATLYLGKVPVAHFSHYKRSLKRHPNNFEFTPGYRSLYGPYLLTTYNWYASSNLSGGLHFDLRQTRGAAAGPDFNYDAGKFGRGDVEYYFARDDHPLTDFANNPLPSNRQRLSFTHRAEFDTNFTFKTAVRYQQDPMIVRDFFEDEYRRNVEPGTFVEVNKAWDNWALDFLAQPRVNDFFETVERLPDVKLTGLRQQMFDTPLFYDSDSSAGYFKRSFAVTNAIQPDFEAFRGDSYHQITLPQTYFGWLNVTPRVGGRVTYYSEAHGPGATNLTEETRGVFNTGAEFSFKASRIWSEAENKLFAVNGLRHIIEPSINYVFVPAPNARPAELPQFDYELPSLRLLPIDYPDYNAVDSIDSQNVLRLSLRNKLQTKRDGGVENLVNWALYTDWRLDPRAGQSTFADLYSDLDMRPRSWLAFSSEVREAINHARVREANHRITLTPDNVWSFSVGHRYLDEDPTLINPFTPAVPVGNNLIYDSFYFKMNENWAFHMSHYFEARDGVMEEQYYTLYRDLRSWTSALTLRLRDNRTGPSDWTIAITFSLKAFPRFKMGQDRDQHYMLLGG